LPAGANPRAQFEKIEFDAAADPAIEDRRVSLITTLVPEGIRVRKSPTRSISVYM
jgi:hypothetical protein